ncbi:MAG: LptF/LptG family permease [Bacteroidales bacterium]|nr:LptF/LptG family permease [Bacteroidales bacterium]
MDLRLKKIDIYIIKKFLGTYFYSILLLAILIIIFDISEKIDDFIDRKAPVSAIIFQYYLNFIPYFVNMFSSLFTFIAVIYFTSRMAANTEIIAILSNGISFWRMLRPYLISALFLTVLSFVLMNYVIPYTNRSLRNFEKVYIKNPFRVNDMNIHMQIRPDTLIYVENFNNIVNIGYRFTMEALNDKGLQMKMSADMIKWDSVKSTWKASNYTIRYIEENREILKRGRELDTVMAFRPEDFVTDIEDAKIMTYNQLNSYIAKEKLRGNKTVGKFDLEKNKRFTFPLQTWCLPSLGLPFRAEK